MILAAGMDVVIRVFVDAVKVGVVELVGDEGAVFALRVGREVFGDAHFVGQGSVGGPDEFGVIEDGAAVFLQPKDVVERFVGAIADGEVIVTFFDDVGLMAFRVVGLEFLFGDEHFDGFRFTGGDADFLIADELDGGLLDAVCFVVGSVGLLQINLHHFFAFTGGGVFDVDGHFEGGTGVFHLIVAISEGRIGEAIAEGIGDGAAVIEGTGVFYAEDDVLITGFVILVADVDTFLIHLIVGVIGTIVSEALLRGVDVFGDVGVLHRRGREVIVGPGVGKVTAWVHRAHEHFTEGLDAIGTRAADP